MLDQYHLLTQVIVVPVAVSLITLTIGGRRGRDLAGWLTFVGLAYSTAILIAIGIGLFTGAFDGRFEASYDWAPYIGRFTLLADGLSTPFAVTIAFLSALIAIYSITYMEHEHNITKYFALYSLYASGMLGTVLATNLAAFFIFFELMLIPSWALIGAWGTGPRERIAFKYFMFTEAGALLLLAGIVAVRFIAGTFDVFSIAAKTSQAGITLLTAIVSAMLIGLFVKMAIFPLHTWLPDAHAEAPTPISALLSPAMIGIGGYAAIRIVYTAFPRVLESTQFTLSIAVLALVTIIYGGLMALAQTDMKRLLAYSSISQMGYLLFGIASLSTIGLTGATILYISHGFAKATLFLVAGIFTHNYGTRNIDDLGGLASRMPYTAVATLISFLGLAGVPPLLGFWGELFIFIGSMYTGFWGIFGVDLTRVVVTSIAVVASVLTAGYGLWTVRRVFYGQIPDKLKDVKEGPPLMLIPVMIFSVILVILGTYPTPIGELVGPVVSSLLAKL
jgi:NADH-quinone oxidoreductase subunit M